LLAITTKKESMALHFAAIGNAALGVASKDYFVKKGKEWKEEDEATGTGVGASARRYRSALSETINRLDGSESRVASDARLPVRGYT
jgi:hypothetical protein